MSRKLIAAVAALVLVPSVVLAQETYRIKLKEPGKGDTGVFRKQNKTGVKVKITDNKGNVIRESKENRTDERGYRQTVLEKQPGAKRAAKLERHYLKAERIEDGRKTTLLYQGKTLLIEKKEGRYVFRIKGGQELDANSRNPEEAKAARDLNAEFKIGPAALQNLGHEWVLPQKAVSPGETWKIDPGPVVRELEAEGTLKIDGARAMAAGKLVRTFRKDGRQFGAIDLQVDLPILSLTEGGMTAKATDGKLTIRFTLEGCIDGTSFAYGIRGTVQSNLDATLDFMGTPLQLSVRFHAALDESREETRGE
jgi:hypothetical protein